MDPALRDRLALVLDVDDEVEAFRLVRELGDLFGVVKVGLELFTAEGPSVVTRLVDQGMRVFLDLKLHDIPTTVGRAARVAGGLGASFLTIHTSGGPAMLRAGAEGLRDGAAAAGHERPMALGVTVLTSDTDAPAELLQRRVAVAVESGCGGVVCGAPDLAEVRRIAPRTTTVVPGIRLPGANLDDQARAATPRAAIDAGADVLVIGRTVTAAPDRRAAAEALVASLGA